MISTLEAYFKGEKELFKGLAIEKYEKDWISYPVIKFSFASGSFDQPSGLRKKLDFAMNQTIKKYDIDHIDESDPAIKFETLINNLYEKTGKQVVILVLLFL